MTDLRSWANRAKRWNDASLRQLASLRQPKSSGPWPLLGMFALGLVAGAIGSYAITQRSEVKRVAMRALTLRDEVLGAFGGIDREGPVAVTSTRPNHRRKAAAEAT